MRSCTVGIVVYIWKFHRSLWSQLCNVFVVVQSLSHVWRCDAMDCSPPGSSILHCLLEFAQIHVHWVSDAICFILCCPLFLLPSIFPSIRVFSSDSALQSGGQSIGASASASVLPMNIQGLFPLELTGLISLLSRGLSRVFSSTTTQKHQFFGTQPSLWSDSHMCTWLLERL